ncbi:MAG: hypothetical protein JWP12_1159 [Bacteroidetes bacterium]|nr:hypothetical protein [Bacteroidota bacterium]
MKKHLAFLTIILFTTSYSLKAQQNITFTEGPELERSVASGGRSPFAQDENSFYIKRENAVGRVIIWIEKFDKKTLKNDYSTQVELMEGKDYFNGAGNSLKFGVLNGQVIMIYDVFSNENKKKFLYERTISPAGVISERKEIGSTECTKFGILNTEYDCTFSKDKSIALIQLKILKKDFPDTPTLMLYDCKAEKSIWTKNSPANYNGAPVNFDVDSIENDGTSYISFSTGNTEANNYHKYNGSIKTGSSDFSDLTEEQFYKYEGDASKYLYSVSDLQLKNGNLARGGMYFEKVANYDPKHPQELKMGSFLSFADPKTKKISLENYGLLSDDVLKKLTYKIKHFSGQSLYPSDKSINTRQVVEMDGSFYVISEHTYTVTIVDEHKTYERTYTSLAHRELVICKFSAAGVFEWSKIIRKASDYNLIVCNGKLHFFYLENVKNEKDDVTNYSPDDDYDDADLKKSNTVCTTLDASGNLVKQVILRPVKDQYYFMPGWAGIPVGTNQLIVRYQYGLSETSNAKFGIITIK